MTEPPYPDEPREFLLRQQSVERDDAVQTGEGMEFSSDGVYWAAPAILDRLTKEAQRDDAMFDDDSVTAELHRRIESVFGHEADVFTVITGSAANGLALAALTPPYGAVLAHWDAHIHTDECGAPEMFTGGAKVLSLPGEHGKINPESLDEYLTHARFGVTHSSQPKVLSLTQATEAGTVYSVSELTALCTRAKSAGLRVQMDGARIANAIATLGCSPADITWKAGVDILCFGGTKNGAIAADAVVVFDKSLSETVRYMRKRSGHFVAKTRFFAAQLDTYLTDDLWLRHARHANAMAAKLASGLTRHPSIQQVHPVEANEVFVTLPDDLLEQLQSAGVRLYANWRASPLRHHRFVTSYYTTDRDIDAVLALVERWAIERGASLGGLRA
jgi:threonine aldolase